MKGTQIIHWGTPKYIKSSLKKDRIYTASKKPRNFCWKLKGPHRFILISDERTHQFLKSVFQYQEFKCTGCGKKKIKFNNL